jgi:hypothetical protein
MSKKVKKFGKWQQNQYQSSKGEAAGTGDRD